MVLRTEHFSSESDIFTLFRVFSFGLTNIYSEGSISEGYFSTVKGICLLFVQQVVWFGREDISAV